MPTKIVVDCSTGISEEIELTAEELKIMSDSAAAALLEQEARDAELATLAANKAAGEAKLADLGLSADEIAALVG